MATKVIVPKIGLATTEVTVVQWLKGEGDWVEAEDPVVSIETEKLTNELCAPATGVLRKIFVQPGQICQVTGLLAVIGGPDETIDYGRLLSESAALGITILPSGALTGEEQRAVIPLVAPEEAEPDASFRGVSPAARRVARELGVDVRQVTGTGPGGRVTAEDMQAHALKTSAASAAPAAAAPAAPTAALVQAAPPASGSKETLDFVRVPREALSVPPSIRPLLGTMRRRIALNMARAVRVACHSTMSLQANVEKLVAFRQGLLELQDSGEVRITYTDLVVKTLAKALVANPMIRTVIDGDSLLTYNNIDISVAVHIGEEGLVVPVIRDCHRLSLQEIARERDRLATAGRSGQLRADELVGGCFTLTNMGGIYDLDAGTPILNLPQSAILGLSSIKKKPVADGDVVRVAPVMNLFLTIDHRVIDGEPALRFLNMVRDILENPAKLVL